MKLSRRLASAMIACAFIAPASIGLADDYPSRPITIVVPYGAGGTTDLSARQVAAMAEKELGQPVVVENRPGASGTNAMRAVAAAKPDGYTLIATTSSPSFVTPALRPVGYDTLKDFVQILNYSGPYHGVVVKADSPYKSLKDLIEAAKSGTTVSYGTAGAMGGAHLAFTAVANATGAKLQHVPFKGSAATTAAVLGGHVNVALVPAYRDLARDGQLRVLAVLDGTRDPDFADTPTLKEAGYDIEFPSIVGIMAPAGTDPAVTAKLETVLTKVVNSKAFAEFMTKLSQPVRVMSGEELKKTIASNLEAYRKLAKQLGQGN
ncbi:MAG: tripartite tricarboxylate transporter substrate binding protein [Hyphomicrobiales bacterium]|mgnify:CR=1 FL=1|nr:MAG: tripartite tricarboxylate transporter substrate binding protein [Hyphomicrobiales bacterium]